MKEKITNLLLDNKIKIHGRYYVDNEIYCFDNVASGIEIKFKGTKISINTKTYARPRINQDYPMFTTICVLVDNIIDPLLINLNIENDDLEEISILKDLEDKEHTIKIFKTDDPLISTWGILDLITDGVILPIDNNKKLNIEVFGDSITSGGDNLIKDGKSLDVVPNSGNGMATYATLPALELNANINVFSRCGLCLYPASSFDREIVVSKIYDKVSPVTLKDWDLKKFIPDIIIISLGTNDELGNQFTIDGFKDACISFVLDLEKIYQNKISYIFTYGYMNKNDDIKNALYKVNNILKDKNIDSYIVEMPKAKIGHPTVEEHLLGARIMMSLINEFKKS